MRACSLRRRSQLLAQPCAPYHKRNRCLNSGPPGELASLRHTMLHVLETEAASNLTQGLHAESIRESISAVE